MLVSTSQPIRKLIPPQTVPFWSFSSSSLCFYNLQRPLQHYRLIQQNFNNILFHLFSSVSFPFTTQTPTRLNTLKLVKIYCVSSLASTVHTNKTIPAENPTHLQAVNKMQIFGLVFFPLLKSKGHCNGGSTVLAQQRACVKDCAPKPQP